MTKEDLISTIKAYSSDLSDELIHDLYEFFDSNVCIPKGETLQANVSEGWIDIFTPSNSIEYRIKPSDPIYEWYCLYKPTLSDEWQPNGYMSQGEIMEWKIQHGNAWDITYVDNTKRERK